MKSGTKKKRREVQLAVTQVVVMTKRTSERTPLDARRHVPLPHVQPSKTESRNRK